MKREVNKNTMPLNSNADKVLEPLTAKEIRIMLLDKEISITELARRWTEATGKKIWPSDISAVIARREGNVFQEIRELLADFLGVQVSQVGREPLREIRAA